jgi:hypothetical protein
MRVLIGMQNILDESDEEVRNPRENVGKNEPAITSIVMLPSLSGRLGRLPVRSDDHLQPRRAILALALLAQQIALAEDADDAGGRVRRSLDCSGPQLLSAETLSRCHSLFGNLLYRFRVFGKVRQPHAAQHVRRLGELDTVVANDLDAIAPRVSEVEERSRQHLNACLGQCPAGRVLVVHNKTEVAPTVRRLAASLLKRSPRSMKAMSLLLPRSLNSKIRS